MLFMVLVLANVADVTARSVADKVVAEVVADPSNNKMLALEEEAVEQSAITPAQFGFIGSNSGYGADCLLLMDGYKQGLRRAISSISAQIASTETRLAANGMVSIDACVAAVTELKRSLEAGGRGITGLLQQVSGIPRGAYSDQCYRVLQNFAGDLQGSFVTASGIAGEPDTWRGTCSRPLVVRMLQGVYASVNSIIDFIAKLP